MKKLIYTLIVSSLLTLTFNQVQADHGRVRTVVHFDPFSIIAGTLLLSHHLNQPPRRTVIHHVEKPVYRDRVKVIHHYPRNVKKRVVIHDIPKRGYYKHKRPHWKKRHHQRPWKKRKRWSAHYSY